MTEEDEAFEELVKRQGDWGMQGSRKHQIMRYHENDAMREVQRLGQEIEEIEYCTVYHCAGDCGQPHNQEEMSEFFAVQPEQEPVAWMDADGNVSDNNDHKCFPIPLYTKEQP